MNVESVSVQPALVFVSRAALQDTRSELAVSAEL